MKCIQVTLLYLLDQKKNSLGWQSVQSNHLYVAKYQSDFSVLYRNIQHKIIVEKIMTHASKTYTMIQ